jgi:oligoendopeptidase F
MIPFSTMRPMPRCARPPGPARRRHRAFGELPEWNLGDLYPAIDAPELKRDLETVESEARRFAEEWKGKLSIVASNNQLGEAIRQYEVLEEMLGRIMSYASLTYAGETANPAKAKFYGDMQQKLTDISSHLLFFALEFNRSRTRNWSAPCPAMRAGALPALGRGSAQGKAVSARRPGRATVP